jgi:flagellar motor switch protein FliM
VRIEADHPTEGILSVCYPGHLLDAIVESEAVADPVETPLPQDTEAMARSVKAAPVQIKACLTGATLTLGELALLQPGDVVVLGIPTSQPALVSIGDVDLFTGDVGRHNGQTALKLTQWMAQ